MTNSNDEFVDVMDIKLNILNVSLGDLHLNGTQRWLNSLKTVSFPWVSSGLN
jgi:hypothetical protein